eukprot:3405843-Pleurochrysis_carterae.AAC.1
MVNKAGATRIIWEASKNEWPGKMDNFARICIGNQAAQGPEPNAPPDSGQAERRCTLRSCRAYWFAIAVPACSLRVSCQIQRRTRPPALSESVALNTKEMESATALSFKSKTAFLTCPQAHERWPSTPLVRQETRTKTALLARTRLHD